MTNHALNSVSGLSGLNQLIESESNLRSLESLESRLIESLELIKERKEALRQVAVTEVAEILNSGVLKLDDIKIHLLPARKGQKKDVASFDARLPSSRKTDLGEDVNDIGEFVRDFASMPDLRFPE